MTVANHTTRPDGWTASVDRGNGTTSVRYERGILDRISVRANPEFAPMSGRDVADLALEALTSEGLEYDTARASIQRATVEAGEGALESVYLLQAGRKGRCSP